MIALKYLLENHSQPTEYISNYFSMFNYCKYVPHRILPETRNQS